MLYGRQKKKPRRNRAFVLASFHSTLRAQSATANTAVMMAQTSAATSRKFDSLRMCLSFLTVNPPNEVRGGGGTPHRNDDSQQAEGCECLTGGWFSQGPGQELSTAKADGHVPL